MVEDRITDGTRIAQLLASELTGLATPPLDRVAVVDADPDAEPTPEGTLAYGVAVDGERVGSVFVHESAAPDAVPTGDDEGLIVRPTDDGVTARVEYGAAVKRAVDFLAETIEA